MGSPQGLHRINTKDSNVAGGMALINIDDNSIIRLSLYIGTALINTVEDKRSG